MHGGRRIFGIIHFFGKKKNMPSSPSAIKSRRLADSLVAHVRSWVSSQDSCDLLPRVASGLHVRRVPGSDVELVPQVVQDMPEKRTVPVDVYRVVPA